MNCEPSNITKPKPFIASPFRLYLMIVLTFSLDSPTYACVLGVNR